MPKSRAHKDEMGLSGTASRKAVTTESNKGLSLGMKSKQYVWPKKTYNGPNYPQDEPMIGVTQSGIMK